MAPDHAPGCMSREFGGGEWGKAPISRVSLALVFAIGVNLPEDVLGSVATTSTTTELTRRLASVDWTAHVITSSADEAQSVLGIDVDGDGDIGQWVNGRAGWLGGSVRISMSFWGNA